MESDGGNLEWIMTLLKVNIFLRNQFKLKQDIIKRYQQKKCFCILSGIKAISVLYTFLKDERLLPSNLIVWN